MTVLRSSVVLLIILGAIPFCFGDPVGHMSFMSPAPSGPLGAVMTEEDNLEFAMETLRQRGQLKSSANFFEVAKNFEGPEQKVLRALRQFRNGRDVLDELRPQEIDLVFDFEQVYQDNPYLEAIELEVYTLDLKAAQLEQTRRLANIEASGKQDASKKAVSPYKQASFPLQRNDESEEDEEQFEN